LSNSKFMKQYDSNIYLSLFLNVFILQGTTDRSFTFGMNCSNTNQNRPYLNNLQKSRPNA
jgi:hypothetical protein